MAVSAGVGTASATNPKHHFPTFLLPSDTSLSFSRPNKRELNYIVEKSNRKGVRKIFDASFYLQFSNKRYFADILQSNHSFYKELYSKNVEIGFSLYNGILLFCADTCNCEHSYCMTPIIEWHGNGMLLYHINAAECFSVTKRILQW